MQYFIGWFLVSRDPQIPKNFSINFENPQNHQGNQKSTLQINPTNHEKKSVEKIIVTLDSQPISFSKKTSWSKQAIFQVKKKNCEKKKL
jgi:ABC-type uncharacterized transport system auxiliary subunit